MPASEMMSAAGPRVRVGSPASLLAAVPVVLKFQPSAPSLVVLGAVPPRFEVAVAVRYDIDGKRRANAMAGHAASILAVQQVTTAYAVGYGPGDMVTPVADVLRAKFAEAGINLVELLRAHEGRYWSYVCTDPGCCPPEGTKYDLSDHPVTRRHAGQVLASREALAATLAPVNGTEAEAMRRATRRAEAHARQLIRETGKFTGQAARRRALYGPGLLAVSEAITRYRAGQSFTSRRAPAWLALVLEDLAVRDDAWARMEREHRGAHLRLWTDVTRLARPGYVAPAASLLAFTAWQDGNGALANIALDRALEDQPGYSMADLVRQALDCGAPPSMARLPMSPEAVAECYARQFDDGQANGSQCDDTDGREPAMTS